jgi:hypothetical protein
MSVYVPSIATTSGLTTSFTTEPTKIELFSRLNILNEHSQECLAIWAKRKLDSMEVVDALTDLFILRGVPAYIRSDNGPFDKHR